ncbi:ComEC/Rec2 family competence protein [Celeribacter sp.]|uniref:ComEC/Rec2 family competence protein n=1 Tax=Celeribacter sp. TaxID=1890673 RepID=UPI003A908740
MPQAQSTSLEAETQGFLGADLRGFALLRMAFAPLESQRDGLTVWVPVLLAIGIGAYFSLPVEPDARAYGTAAAVALLGLVGFWRLAAPYAFVPAAFLLVASGFLAAGLRAHMVAEPVLEGRYFGAMEGRVVAVDRSVSGALRLTFEPVTLMRRAPAQTPTRVRVSLYGDPPTFSPAPGQWLALTANLSPPAGPTEPRGFDFQRMAWFDGLGAVGYTRTPVIRIAPPERGIDLLIHRLRMDLSRAIQQRIDGQAGAFAAAILTGDRSGVSEATKEALRLSNLSHLLAISGLHMGLMTAAVYAAFRFALNTLPRWPLPVSAKSVAALIAMAAGAFYLALSGFNVATERAFIMVCVLYLAVIAGRRAISLRAVALAATIILLGRPETLAEPGFQMSFAATTALVCAFSAFRDLTRRKPPLVSYGENPAAFQPRNTRLKRFALGTGALIISSAVAGLATAPVAAAHFNRIADYGLAANIVSVPLMGLIIIPAALAALVLAPFGLDALAFAVMAFAIKWILAVAETVSGWEGAVTYVPAPPAATLPLLAIGALVLALWQGRGRVVGIGPLVAGVALWFTVERPALLVSADAALIGVLEDEGRVLNKARGQGFAARTWLENDGTGAQQQEVARQGMTQVRLGDWRISHVTGRDRAARARTACMSANIVIVNEFMDFTPSGECKLFDLSKFNHSGALAFSLGREGLIMETARGAAGVRLWNTPELRQRDPPDRATLMATLPQGVLGETFGQSPAHRYARR